MKILKDVLLANKENENDSVMASIMDIFNLEETQKFIKHSFDSGKYLLFIF
jgi:ABC-type metal ion transport system substrate-binding protein